ncbi:MAG TPA: hypothetical protein VGJ93_01800 [Desulfuromonadaceae bacterium]|jgi:hypothetical protein
MAAKHIFPLYSQNTGLEITPEIKANTGKAKKVGIVMLRFFLIQPPADGKTTQVKFQLEPWEAFDLSMRMNKMFREGGKEKITHKFTPLGGKEVVTNVTVEKWEREEEEWSWYCCRPRRCVYLCPSWQRQHFSVLYAAEFLKFLSTRQGWVDREAA